MGGTRWRRREAAAVAGRHGRLPRSVAPRSWRAARAAALVVAALVAPALPALTLALTLCWWPRCPPPPRPSPCAHPPRCPWQHRPRRARRAHVRQRRELASRAQCQCLGDGMSCRVAVCTRQRQEQWALRVRGESRPRDSLSSGALGPRESTLSAPRRHACPVRVVCHVGPTYLMYRERAGTWTLWSVRILLCEQ